MARHGGPEVGRRMIVVPRYGPGGKNGERISSLGAIGTLCAGRFANAMAGLIVVNHALDDDGCGNNK